MVERFDVTSKRLADRLVYVGQELVREEQIVSSHTREDITRRYDGLHRLTEKTSCFTMGAGEPEWIFTWRPPGSVSEVPATEATRTAISYLGDARAPHFARIDWTGGGESTRMKLCSAFDSHGLRTRRFQTYLTSRPGELQVNVRSYTWADTKLSSVDTRDLVLKGVDIKSRSRSRLDFVYDQAGRLAQENSKDSKIQFRYDERGRFIAFGSVTFDWDDAGRLKGFHPGDPAMDGTFEWDSSGRILRAQFVNGEGFEVKYGASCAAGFSPPAVTPGVEGYLVYDGMDEL